MNIETDRLIREYSKGLFDDNFVEVAKEDLPLIFGRMSLLEEYYRLNRGGGDPERQGLLVEQLARHPVQPGRLPKRGFLGRLKRAFR